MSRTEPSALCPLAFLQLHTGCLPSPPRCGHSGGNLQFRKLTLFSTSLPCAYLLLLLFGGPCSSLRGGPLHIL